MPNREFFSKINSINLELIKLMTQIEHKKELTNDSEDKEKYDILLSEIKKIHQEELRYKKKHSKFANYSLATAIGSAISSTFVFPVLGVIGSVLAGGVAATGLGLKLKKDKDLLEELKRVTEKYKTGLNKR